MPDFSNPDGRPYPDFSVPQRQEVLGVVIYFFNNVRKFGNILLPLLAAVFVKPQLFWIMISLLSAGLIGLGILAWFQYRRFTFYLGETELSLNEGVFVRDRTTIPFERIQTVHLHQNFIQRILDLTGVKIDTAGSKKKELEIKALSKPDAVRFQQELQRRVEGRQGSEIPAEQTGSVQEAPARTEKLVTLSPLQLLVVAVTENHIRNGLLAAAVIFGYISQYERFVDAYLEPWLQEVMPALERSSLVAVIFIIIVFLVMSMIISMVKVILKYYDLEASLSGNVIQVKNGLLKRNEYTIPLKKIQFLEWETNFLRKLPGFETVKIFQAQSHEQSSRTAVDIPAVALPQTERIMGTVFPEMDGEFPFATFKADRSYIRFLVSIFSLLGAAGAAAIHYLLDYSDAWYYFGGYIVLVILLTIQFVRSVRLHTNGELIIFERGWLFPKRTVLKTFKLQSVKWRQTIFQKRRGVGHITLFTAGGKRSIRFMPIQLVRELHNYLLYRVEVTKRDWM